MNSVLEEPAIGGYFSLERLCGNGLPWIEDAVGYCSARSALTAVLIALQPATIWVPYFICSAVNTALQSAAAIVRHYALTESLGVPDEVCLTPDDVVICVDYFGINADSVALVIDRFGPGRVIVDASQSLFYTHQPEGTTIYSPRKFLGIPDGGLLRTPLRLAPRLAAIEADSIMRSQHLLFRLGGMTSQGYAKFQEAELSLYGCEPVALSRVTEAMLKSVDIDAIAMRRISNYRRLEESLSAAGFEVFHLPPGAVPMCCPIRCDDANRVRKELAMQGIFTPTYWPDVAIPDSDHVGLKMRDCTLYLPCDQRYGDLELQRVAGAIIKLMEAR